MSVKHHNVYVIELSPGILSNRKFLRENRGFNRSLPCYYIGMTGLTPEERFKNHRNEYKSSNIAHRYGVRLVPELYEQYNPMTYKEAVSMEIKLATKLKRRGHGVWQR